MSASVKEPVPGWIEGINGPTGLMLAIGKGILRSYYCDPTSNVEAIPVDLACNAMIAIGCKRATTKGSKMLIYNLSTAGIIQNSISKRTSLNIFFLFQDINSQTWGQMTAHYSDAIEEYPFDFLLWKPNCKITSNYYLYIVFTFFFQYLPAVLIDLLLMVLRKKTL